MSQPTILIHALLLMLITLVTACQPEEATLSSTTNQTFYVENAGSCLRMQVRGNTRSGKIILTIHGGPGGSSFYLSDLAAMQQQVEPSFAVAYLDQPMAGGAQGNRPAYSIDDIADGVRKAVLTLKHLYGKDQKIILFSESWGGLIATAFLTTGNNQTLVAGWVNADGPHDFHLGDREIIRMAIRVGTEQIRLGKNVERWQEIVSYCQANDPTDNYEVAKKLNELLGEAEYLIDEVVRVEFSTLQTFRNAARTNQAPLTALGLNLLANRRSGVEREGYTKRYEQTIRVIQTPLLILWGKYDFIVPPAVGDSLYKNVRSTVRRRVLLERSGHNGFLQEPAIFWPELMAFVKAR